MDTKVLATRSISGLIYVILIVGCIFLGVTATNILASVFGMLATYEFTKITHQGKSVSLTALILDMAAMLCLVWMSAGLPLMVFVPVLLVRFISELYIHSENPLRNAALSVLGIIYIGLPLGMMMFIPTLCRESTMPLLAIFIMIWLNDTGAFLVGSMIGRHRLFERISPKKSWEGFFGGLALNIIAAILFAMFCPKFFSMNFGIPFWVGTAIIITSFSTWGDLFESLCKRTLHIKDSGNLIPGHGGILDRIDSLLFVMPAMAVYIMFAAIAGLCNSLQMF
ncbi:MAG: phosphatidate cytidylyltransferase [Muribaculum sp.]|nr:phosphatidate cytidylyltransferase [Muribaculum sp.]